MARHLTPAERTAAEGRLPKWAQDEMARLRRAADDWKTRANVGPEDSDTFTWGYPEPGKPLGRGTNIQFHRGDGSHYSVYITDDGTLIVGLDSMRSAADTLHVVPQSANRLRVTVGGYPT